MSPNGFEYKRVLVVDDFDNFRTTVMRMLQEFGARSVDTAAHGNDAVSKCRSTSYDLVLCDYNLGPGKSGQQVLEQLRHESLLKHSSLFVLISAESSKNIVMATYDYEPDAYLTKPITAKTLQQRLERLFHQSREMCKVYNAMDDGDLDAAITRCGELLRGQSRVRPLVQKLLGRLLLRTGQFNPAEQLFRKVLQVRELDWAMVGLALAKKGQDDWVGAQQWVEQALSLNPMCMPAYDLLADIHAARGDRQEQQHTLAQAVEISPLSIMRQQELGAVAYQNHDLEQALEAFKNSIKLGEHSCYDDKDVYLQFIRSCAELAPLQPDVAKSYAREVGKSIGEFGNRFGRDGHNDVLLRSANCAYLAATGEQLAAQQLLQELMEQHQESPATLAAQLDWISACEVLGRQEWRDQLVNGVLQQYQGNEAALEMIDRVLENPTSEKNRQRVAQINKQGIAYYEGTDFEAAIDCFNRAVREFPKHVGIELNLLQALIGALEQSGQPHLLKQAKHSCERLGQLVDGEHPQADRLAQLVGKFQEVSQQILRDGEQV
ncbi:response regulator [Gilvimarinus agarilyticus]|uniref:response regulator n=1 Tax=unclassified Gilvimarinus TaxID=2642066 RepID=UPI001C09BD46|nr:MULTISPECIES: response regulator [unclassified Gilvimarinus]MBU2885116.1 response regulator [Gilvimarinus agarilyticus]MDO6570014.1 response regulator [Gilvimarinus sp. 2_MG-2023]MDO6747281.1 response regulator [Gilvimarinus sp. 1_MG-2023]